MSETKTRQPKVNGLPYFENRESCGLRVAFYIQDETPKLVAKAVRIVMAMWMIFCQMFLFSMFFPIYV